MRFLLAIILCLPLSAKAAFLFQYGINYTSQDDSSTDGKFTNSRTFHKAVLAASLNGKKTLFFGWNINSWSSSLSQGSNDEETYSMLEMGPRLQWFTNDDYKIYLTAEWNPYAKGKRDKSGTSSDINGSSIGIGAGYRFRISKLLGLGASIQYHTLSVKEEKVGDTTSDVSDSVRNIMPMLELTLITR